MNPWTLITTYGRIAATILYLLVILTWTLPEAVVPFKRDANPYLLPVMLFTNLWQHWDMFAPHPRDVDIWTDVTYVDDKGQTGHWNLTKMNDMPYVERWRKERWRKYFNDYLRTDAERALWKPFAEYTARKLNSEGTRVTSLTLRRWWRPTQNPVSPEMRADKRADEWNHFEFYKWPPDSLGTNR